MALTKEEASELARILHARSGGGRTIRPKLRVVTPAKTNLLDHFERENHIRRIIYLRDGYRLRWLVDQCAFKAISLWSLDDEEIVKLHALMERARRCIVEGISFEDAGLVASLDEHESARRTMFDHDADRVADETAIKIEQRGCAPLDWSLFGTDDECPF